MSARSTLQALEAFHPAVRDWFAAAFAAPTAAQVQGWPPIARGESTLILAPTGSGKTLAAFLWCIDRVMFEAVPSPRERCRVLYVSPLKALAVDVERNLRAPIIGVAAMADFRSEPHHVPAVAVRTGDTPQRERARLRREPADVLITTPESLYLLLTSASRETLRSIDTVILDEIHALVPTKRGAHLMLSLERLEALTRRPLQRIGLSATQRPLDEIARFLGGAQPPGAPSGPGAGPTPRRPPAAQADPADLATSTEFVEASGAPRDYRPVTVVDAGEGKGLRVTIEVPVEDMARLGEPIDPPRGAAAQGPVRASIWTAIHPRLLDLVRQHRSTLIFVNSRRVAERLAGALNELAGETLALAHHGSIARPQRLEIEERLKAGAVRALVATSSLELGIDMGAIDLVVQIEAPPSVASGVQRIGRAGHRVGEVSEGIVFPKYRGDLVACAAVARLMHEGRVEASRYPRNPLDVLAQQVVAMTAFDAWDVDALFGLVRRAAPYAELSRAIFEGVLDMLAGRYPSDDFAELRPRVTWDRVANTVVAREGARHVAVVNGGTIPDRGLYGVFLAGASPGAARVGELDEEMVFESRVGETFVLGASSWRIDEITHDRVVVSPAPGEPGKMPFWRGDGPARPHELGLAIGRLIRELRQAPPTAAIARLVERHDLDRRAAENLVTYLADQGAAGAVPDDRTLVIERTRDELGDWRVCVLSPLGGRIHAPWAMAVAARARRQTGADVETLWTDDGFVVRFPQTEEPPDPGLMLPGADEVEALVLGELGGTALFAAKFREVAARALLLPRRRPGGRAPLWQQRKRAADLLAVAAQFGSFPMLLETYRECLRDVFDMPALVATLRDVERQAVRVATVDARVPSPFAASLLFGYVANYIYEGDAPLAERRAQALSIDQAQLRELLGEAELRELLDPDTLDEVERRLQHLEEHQRARTIDGVHDLLLRLGDLAPEELRRRTAGAEAAQAIDALVGQRRALALSIAGETRYVAVENAGRYRDALGLALPPGVPAPFLEPVRDPRGDLAHRYARTHGPFTTEDLARRLGLARTGAEGALRRLAAAGKLLEGAFRPGGTQREWCDPDVLGSIRRRTLAALRHQVEPVEPAVLARLLTAWQGVTRRRAGLDALLDVVESLQGAPLPASLLEREILPARLDGYQPGDLDALAAAGEVVWVGLEPLGERDGRLALFLTDQLGRLWRPPLGPGPQERGRVEGSVLAHLAAHGASFFTALQQAVGGFAGDLVDALWSLVWSGLVTNDTFHALRAYTAPIERRDRRDRRTARRPFRSRRATPPAAEGRWSLTAARAGATASATEWSAAVAQQLLARHGVLTRETVAAEAIPGGFSAVYEVLKALEDAGRVRRGYFAAGLGAAQFALPAALEQLRALRDEPETPEVIHLAATDPANPYGATLAWPEPASPTRPSRSVGASVVLVNGACAAWVARGGRALAVWLPEDEPARAGVARAVARELAARALAGGRHGGLLVSEIDGAPAATHALAPFLVEAGFAASAMGFNVSRQRVTPA
ncbi:MAG: DEAD/DEAH box helicase [Candidatus Rokubacteria bacterium]|nr:DEAD/DEAH box helicase [Candidatus Rokubacteria bacterium]